MTSLSVVIPAFDEAARLPATLVQVRAHLGTLDRASEIIVADDGSRDATASLARDAGAVVVSLPVNRGKGAAVRAGVLAAANERILVCDADLATPITALADLDAALDAGADIAIGSRRTNGTSASTQPLARRLFGAGFHALVRATFGLAVHDTTCGFKLFSREAARDLFARSHTDRFAYDVEILYLARARWRVDEVAVPWHHVAGSRVALHLDIARTARELLAIRVRGRDFRRRSH
jgi:dolichyl-phosphate beta-glucosyltransferase